MGEQRGGAGTGNQARLRHSLSVCDSEKLSHRGEGLAGILSLPRRREQAAGSELQEHGVGSGKSTSPLINAGRFFLSAPEGFGRNTCWNHMDLLTLGCLDLRKWEFHLVPLTNNVHTEKCMLHNV